MLRVGLTGNPAAGKSTVLALFKQWGAGVIDSDGLAREAVAPGSPALDAIFQRFGGDLRLPDGSLDRASLRRRVLANDEQRAVLSWPVVVLDHTVDLEAERLVEPDGTLVRR